MYLVGYFYPLGWVSEELRAMLDDGRFVDAVNTYAFPDGEKNCETVEEFEKVDSDGPTYEVDIDGSKYFIALSRGHGSVGFCKLIGD